MTTSYIAMASGFVSALVVLALVSVCGRARR